MATPRPIEQQTGPGALDVKELGGDAELDPELVVDLALSVGAAVVWRFDCDTDTITWMPGLDQLLGLAGADDELVRQRLAELIAPLTVAAKAAPAWEAFDLEQTCATPGGDTRWIQFRARVSAFPAGRYLVGIAIDVTGQHHQQQALTDLADRYRLLVELSPEAIVVHEAGQVVYANPAALRFVRAGSTAEIVGRPITDFVHADSVPQMLRRIAELGMPGATSDPAEAVLVRFDGGTIDIESVSVRTTWEGRPAFQVIMRDVTAQKAAGAALHFQA
ncbi:MAG: PAS domain-containing protein, partial [Stackebrandtia sp.]